MLNKKDVEKLHSKYSGIDLIGVEDSFNELPEKEKKVLEMRVGLNGLEKKTLLEVGRELGVTRERVRQIEAKAIERIKKRYLENKKGRFKKFKL